MYQKKVKQEQTKWHMIPETYDMQRVTNSEQKIAVSITLVRKIQLTFPIINSQNSRKNLF